MHDGELTGRDTGKLQVFVAAWEDFPGEVTVEVVRLNYGPIEETMDGPYDRMVLGKRLGTFDYNVPDHVHEAAKQCERAVRNDEIDMLPPALQAWAYRALAEVADFYN